MKDRARHTAPFLTSVPRGPSAVCIVRWLQLFLLLTSPCPLPYGSLVSSCPIFGKLSSQPVPFVLSHTWVSFPIQFHHLIILGVMSWPVAGHLLQETAMFLESVCAVFPATLSSHSVHFGSLLPLSCLPFCQRTLLLGAVCGYKGTDSCLHASMSLHSGRNDVSLCPWSQCYFCV